MDRLLRRILPWKLGRWCPPRNGLELAAVQRSTSSASSERGLFEHRRQEAILRARISPKTIFQFEYWQKSRAESGNWIYSFRWRTTNAQNQRCSDFTIWRISNENATDPEGRARFDKLALGKDFFCRRTYQFHSLCFNRNDLLQTWRAARRISLLSTH